MSKTSTNLTAAERGDFRALTPEQQRAYRSLRETNLDHRRALYLARELDFDADKLLALIEQTAKAARVPMTHVPKDPEYLPVLGYRVGQEIEASERRLRLLRELQERVERLTAR